MRRVSDVAAEIWSHVMDQLLFKIEEVTKVLGASRSTVYRLMNSGQLVSIKVGRSRRVTSQALERFVKAMEDRSRQDLAGDCWS
jgi:excisionase family DNA binding protein